MSIRLKLREWVTLSDLWMSKEDWDEDFKDNLPALIELLNEDIFALIEDVCGREGLIIGADWVD